MKKASLFSGIGGIDLAAHWAGMETVVFCEREPFPQRVLRKHWPDVPIIDDVHDFTREELERLGIGAIDIISAGYPCQPFSVAGKRRGAEDDRHLWPEVKRVLEEIRPRWFVGENVAGHVTLGLDDVLADLESLDYTAQPIVIPACAIGAGHRRDRVFIVAYSASEGLQKWGQSRFAKAKAEDGAGMEPEFERCGEDVAHTSCTRRKKCDDAAITDQSEQCSRRGYAGRAHGARRSTQPGMGGSFNELSAEMDGGGLNPLDALKDFIDSYPQPALMGQPQYEWEPSRVATGVKNRAARLKALGNAVDPLQIYPIMYAIKLIDDYLRTKKHLVNWDTSSGSAANGGNGEN